VADVTSDYFAGTLITVGAIGGEPGPTWGARIAAFGVLGVTFGLAWWTARPLPAAPGRWPGPRSARTARSP
jgi:hypothetical protein